MNRLSLVVVALLIATSILAQSPEKMSYQAVVRKVDGELVTNFSIGMQLSILQGVDAGSATAIYVERQFPTTNLNGLVNIEIGSGMIVSGDFTAIDWASGPYFIKTETDINGGANYTITGISQLLSVPYALFAKTAETVTGKVNEIDPLFTTSPANGISQNDISSWNDKVSTELDPQFSNWDKNTGISITENQISDLQTYLTSETDPSFTASQAANITAGDITNLENLSGINTGDQDLSSYAIQNALEDSTEAIRGDMLTNDLNGENIYNLADPVNSQDATTKAYVDALRDQINSLEEMLISSGQYIVEDIEGNTYDVIKIGTQLWMNENLRVTHYADGTSIPNVKNNLEWGALTTPSYSWYNNDSASYAKPYGALYNWHTVNNGELCPNGWHMSTEEDWLVLSDYLGGELLAGGKLKEAGFSHWSSPNTGATNESGFTALPSGRRDVSGVYSRLGTQFQVWVSSETSESRYLSYSWNGIEKTSASQKYGFSVRCVKN